jgi:glycerol dehydrogenase-like iron-containing ADH family enzyme
MPQQIDTNQLKKAEAAVALSKELINQAIQQSAADQLQCEEALKQAAAEIAQAQTLVSQAQSSLQVLSNHQSE